MSCIHDTSDELTTNDTCTSVFEKYRFFFFFQKRLRRVKSEHMPVLLVSNLFLRFSVCWENDMKFILILILSLHLSFKV